MIDDNAGDSDDVCISHGRKGNVIDCLWKVICMNFEEYILE